MPQIMGKETQPLPVSPDSFFRESEAKLDLIEEYRSLGNRLVSPSAVLSDFGLEGFDPKDLIDFIRERRPALLRRKTITGIRANQIEDFFDFIEEDPWALIPILPQKQRDFIDKSQSAL